MYVCFLCLYACLFAYNSKTASSIAFKLSGVAAGRPRGNCGTKKLEDVMGKGTEIIIFVFRCTGRRDVDGAGQP